LQGGNFKRTFRALNYWGLKTRAFCQFSRNVGNYLDLILIFGTVICEAEYAQARTQISFLGLLRARFFFLNGIHRVKLISYNLGEQIIFLEKYYAQVRTQISFLGLLRGEHDFSSLLGYTASN
jgi:hypothetical protein